MVAVLVARQHVRMVEEQLDGVHQQIVEVARVAGLQQFVVTDIHAADDLGAVVVGRIVGRADQLVLGAGDVAEHGARIVAFRIDIQLDQRLLDDGLLVAGVEDQVVARAGGELGLDAQNARADRVERPDRQAVELAGAAQQVHHALFHLAGGLVGEGHRHDVPRADVHVLDQVGDTVGQHAGLAAARPGQDKHRAFARRHCGLLLLVQPFQNFRYRHADSLLCSV